MPDDDAPIVTDHVPPVVVQPAATPPKANRKVWLRRVGSWVGTLALWYVSVLLVVNLIGSPALAGGPVSSLMAGLFPRFGTSGSNLDQQSINQMWSLIQSNYVYRDVPGSLGTSGAESGIAEDLEQTFGDHFTLFFTPAENSSLNQQLSGTLTGGIGIGLGTGCGSNPTCPTGQNANDLIIDEVMRNQPADKAGVETDDVLESVNGTKVSSLGATPDDQLDKVTSLIEGNAGTQVTLSLLRSGTAVSVTITRQNLVIPSVYTQRFGSTLYLQISGFDNDTGTDVHNALSNLTGVTGIVLDLRDNGGGYIDDAQSVVSEFVSPGGNVKDVVTQRGRMTSTGGPSSAQQVTEYPVEGGGLATNPAIKVAILVNGDTASAAEITTMALRDYNRATVVGEQTYGKGTVQVTYSLPDGNSLHLTIGKWYGPDDESIDGVGITPKVVVPLSVPTERFELDIESGPASGDPQLQAALALVAPSS